ncbi:MULTISPECIES: DUF456 domain-containing protein [Flavobacteriaceae]|uniref:DUF456 domain-containing protein n=2 Tax=Flavobacteriaceae TaxID=49546 RepID=A0A4Y8ATS2_9FLAO|nr:MULTISPECIES: DUF456 domain-containing protein [Flavobacteriaceae]TEW75267.1 DUF456 domain-containing protein [Gramella jeungdoensis]GGK43767.1 membrane protein [Lutibacter litoralis]
MDIALLIFGILLMILGVLGSFLPVLPGPITSWFGLLVLHLSEAVPMNWTFLGITFAIAFIIWLIDYFIPAMGTKRFGGSRYGVIGTMVGLVLGILFFPPLGLIIGPFLGAFVGELIKDNKDSKRALRAAYGSFIGFLTSTFLKFIAAVIYTGLFFSIFWDYKSVFF